MVCLLLTGSCPAQAVTSCILPVEGEEPLSAVEAEQPYRLATNPITLPGYSGLLLRPLNRPGRQVFHEIDGRTYRHIQEPAPGSNIFDSDVKQVSAGDRFLLG